MAEYIPGLVAADKASVNLMNKIIDGANKLTALGKRVEAVVKQGNYKFSYSPRRDEYNLDEADDPSIGAYEYSAFLGKNADEIYDKISLWLVGFDIASYIEDNISDLYANNNNEYSDVWACFEEINEAMSNLAEGLHYWNQYGADDAEFSYDGGWYFYPEKFTDEYPIEGITGDIIYAAEGLITLLNERISEQQSLEQWQGEGGKSMNGEQISAAAEESAAVCGDIADAAIEGVDLLKQATGSKSPELIKRMAQVLKSAKIKLENTPGIVSEDIAAIDNQIDDLDDIASRQHFSDIRSWEAKAVQKEDARLALGRIHQYWKGVAEEYTATQYNRRKSFATKNNLNPAMPNYRFNVGQMVKVGNRYGKVIGASKEGGTGKQVYEVRINGADKVRRCSASEMKSVDGTTKNTSNLNFI